MGAFRGPAGSLGAAAAAWPFLVGLVLCYLLLVATQRKAETPWAPRLPRFALLLLFWLWQPMGGVIWQVANPHLPFGGYKESGLGRELGPEVMDLYTEVKAVCIGGL